MAHINLIMDHISQYVPFDEGFLRVSVKIVIQFLKAYFSADIIHLEGPLERFQVHIYRICTISVSIYLTEKSTTYFKKS